MRIPYHIQMAPKMAGIPPFKQEDIDEDVDAVRDRLIGMRRHHVYRLRSFWKKAKEAWGVVLRTGGVAKWGTVFSVIASWGGCATSR